MTGEINVFGVYVSPLLIYAVFGLAITYLIRRGLTALGFYRLVWHAALFDLALFVLVWAGVAAMFGSAPA